MTLKPLPLKNIDITDTFWSERIRIAREVSIDYMWKAINDEIPNIPPSGCIRNFKIAAGLEEGTFTGWHFQDTDLYKWLEAVSYSLEVAPDKELEARADYAIDLISKAQMPDGYIDTCIQLRDDYERWTDTCHAHEMYCCGHLIEAAVAHKTATGKDSLLNIARKFADHVDSVFGPDDGKKRGYPGHQEIEPALYKLYKATGDEKYLKLAYFFLDERGRTPNYYDIEYQAHSEETRKRLDFYRNHNTRSLDYYSYLQAHIPVYDQKEAVGHAVRCVYMIAGMADVGGHMSEPLLDAARDLYRNIVDTQMYITGGIGSMLDGEAFTFSYDLPNDIMYSETCASIGLMMVCRRLGNIDRKSEYADIMERALYNTVLAGISLAGTEYFYVNPLEMWPERSLRREDYDNIKSERQAWYGCACCPPNILRTLLGLGEYIYSHNEAELFVNLYISNIATFEVNGSKVTLKQESDYIKNGNVRFTISTEKPIEMALHLRLPSFCDTHTIKICRQQEDEAISIENGYAVIKRIFTDGDVVDLSLPIKSQFIYSNDKVPYNAFKTALKRGPLVYCTEEADNGKELWNLSIDTTAPITESQSTDLPGNPTMLVASGSRSSTKCNNLYSTDKPEKTDEKIKLIPYFMWGNRGTGEMSVWQNVER